MKYAKIVVGNMGDGWSDQEEAADGYGDWLVSKGYVDDYEIIDGIGCGGGVYDEFGELIDSDGYWSEWCGSEEALEYCE